VEALDIQPPDQRYQLLATIFSLLRPFPASHPCTDSDLSLFRLPTCLPAYILSNPDRFNKYSLLHNQLLDALP
jgi:hypothetical protein